MYVCLFVRMEQLCFHYKDFHEPSYFSIFRKSVLETQFSLKSGTNNGQFILRLLYIFDRISLSFS